MRCITFILLFALTSSIGSAQSLNELRGKYMAALHDYSNAPEVYKTFSEIKDPSAKILAYRGALEAIMTKTTWNLFKKMSYLRQSEKSFQTAIAKSPQDIEIRFMRMAVQYEIPEYLGFSNDMETDRAFIVKHIENFNPTNFPHETLVEIFGFMNRCNKFTQAQIEKFKGILALKN